MLDLTEWRRDCDFCLYQSIKTDNPITYGYVFFGDEKMIFRSKKSYPLRNNLLNVFITDSDIIGLTKLVEVVVHSLQKKLGGQLPILPTKFPHP